MIEQKNIINQNLVKSVLNHPTITSGKNVDSQQLVVQIDSEKPYMSEWMSEHLHYIASVLVWQQRLRDLLPFQEIL